MFAPVKTRALALILLGALAVSVVGCRGATVKPVAPAEATPSTGAGATEAATVAAVASTTGVTEVATEAPAPLRRPAKPVVLPGTIFKGVETSRKLMALTFDDGPSGNLQPILDALSRTDARATFFVVGERCAGHDDLLGDIVASGNELANHSWDHQEVDGDSSTSEIVRSLARTKSCLEEAGHEAPTLFRPPAGHYDHRLAGITADLGLATALWDIRSGDTDGASADRIVDNVLAQAHPGGIVLMHETSPDSVDALPRVIKGLRARGYRLVTVSELLAAGRAEEVTR